MKKILISMLVISMVISLLPIGIYAESDVFTQQQAEELFVEAYKRLIMIEYGYVDEYDSLYIEKSDYIDYEYPYYGVKAYFFIFDMVPHTYGLVVDERFNTIDKCVSYLSEVLTDDLATKLVYFGNSYTVGKEELPIFGLSDNAFWCLDNVKEAEKAEKGNVLFALPPPKNSPAHHMLKDIGTLKVNGDKATMDVVGYLEKQLFDDTGDGYETFEVEFEKTSNGWRVSGGSYINLLTKVDKIKANPSTGDSSPAVVGLALAALVSLAAPFVVKRRRVR